VGEGDGAILNKFPNVMELDVDVLYIWGADVIFGKSARSVVVAQERGGSRRPEAEAGEEFTKKQQFMRGVMKSNVLSIT